MITKKDIQEYCSKYHIGGIGANKGNIGDRLTWIRHYINNTQGYDIINYGKVSLHNQSMKTDFEQLLSLANEKKIKYFGFPLDLSK